MDFTRSADHLTRPGQAQMHSRYDGAQETRDNAQHWVNSDNYGPNYSNSGYVRERLRRRSRYEAVENNSYLKGIVLSLCNDFVCSGPSLHMVDKRLTEAQSQAIEIRFQEYASKILLRQLLWKLRHAKCVDGEGFAIQFTDRYLADTPIIGIGPDGQVQRATPNEVTVNWQVIEAEQCTSLDINLINDRQIDGIRFDRNMRPREYFILYRNPYDMNPYLIDQKEWGRWLPADYILHWTRQERPWLRGVPETTQALPLCAYLRRYNLAVLAAAETAASFAGVLESQAPASQGPIFGQGGGNLPQSSYESKYEDFDAFPIERGMFTKIPDGAALKQMDAKQPTERHEAFVDTVVREIARAMQVPFNIATGFSGGYNFASGTLDRQQYNGAIMMERQHCEDTILRQILNSWWSEAARIPGYLPDIDNVTSIIPRHVWRWDVKPEHADPSKVAESLVSLWEAGMITDDQVQIERFNRDPEEHYRSLKRQNEKRTSLGMPLPGQTLVTQDTTDGEGNTKSQTQSKNQTGSNNETPKERAQSSGSTASKSKAQTS